MKEAVRAGDVYALLVEYYFAQRKHRECYELLERMRQKRIPLLYFLDKSAVVSIYQAVGVNLDFLKQEEEQEGIKEELS